MGRSRDSEVGKSSSGEEGVQRCLRGEGSPETWLDQPIKQLVVAHAPLMSHLLFHEADSRRDHRLWESRLVLVGFLGVLH